MVKLKTTLDNAKQGLNHSSLILNSLGSLEPKIQFAIAEVLMLRSFSIFENSIAEIAYKLASGAKYINPLHRDKILKA